jgi:hypothetical protein
MFTHLYRSEIVVRTAASGLGSFNAMGVIGRVKWWHLVTKDKVHVIIIMNSTVKAAGRIVRRVVAYRIGYLIILPIRGK